MSVLPEDIPANIMSIITTDLFKKLLNNDIVKISEVIAATSLLLKANIPFDLSFSTGSRRTAAATEFSIYIKPNATLDIVIQFESGTTIFSD